MAQGFQLHEPELWAFLSLDDGPTRPSFGMAGPGWLMALGLAWHITILEYRNWVVNTCHIASTILHEGTSDIV